MQCVRSRGDLLEDRIQVAGAYGDEMLHDVQCRASCNMDWESNADNLSCVVLRARQLLSLRVGDMLSVLLLVLVM
jgi:hypothetical protein